MKGGKVLKKIREHFIKGEVSYSFQTERNREQRVDSTIHWINHHLLFDLVDFYFTCYRIVISPLNSTYQPLNNYSRARHFLTTSPQARIGSESIAHEAKG